jgi:hypothetical protein
MQRESLRERAVAALELYVATALMIADALQLEHRDVVIASVERIMQAPFVSHPNHIIAEESR